MQTRAQGFRGVLVLAVAAALSAGPAMAEKPAWAGGGKDDKHPQKVRERHDDRPVQKFGDRHEGERRGGAETVRSRSGSGVNVSIDVGLYFGERHRTVLHDYFVREYRSGHCPPGLAKKRNGCLPPGQAKKWRVGHRLPRDVVFHDLPPSVVIELGPPPAGHRFVRVAADILLIAVGTAMVVDAIEDLGRL